MGLREIAIQFVVAVLAVSFLASCSGGGGESPPTVSTPTVLSVTCRNTGCSDWTCPTNQTCDFSRCGRCKAT